jgi:hypothetical protein
MRAEALLVPLLTTTPPGFTMPAVVMDVSTDNSVTHEEQKKSSGNESFGAKEVRSEKARAAVVGNPAFWPFCFYRI